MSHDARAHAARTSSDLAVRRRGERGFSLVELMVAIGVTLVLLAIVPRALTAITDANAYSQGTSAAAFQARNAVQQLTYRVQSAKQICLPTQLTTAGPTVAAGFAVRVETLAFGKDQWDQWIVDTGTHQLEEQDWSPTWVSGNAVPAWNTVATMVVNSATAPFSLPTVATGSPQTLSVDLQVTETFGHTTQTAELKTTLPAFNTPYTSSPTVTCATAHTQEGWT